MLLLFALPLGVVAGRLVAHWWVGYRSTSAPLVGFTKPVEPIGFSVVTWRRREFQTRIEGWFSENLPGRASVIRLTNQAYYTLFRKSHMYRRDILVGKEGHLFERPYLRAYCTGVDPARHASLTDRIAHLRGRLNARRHGLVVLLTPSKAVTLPEFLPFDRCPAPTDPERPATGFATMLKNRDVPLVDGPVLVRRMKTEDPLPPFPRGGTHWSNLAALRVAGRLVGAIGDASSLDIGAITVGEPRWDGKPIGSESDLAVLLNLQWPPLDYATGVAAINCRGTAAGRERPLIAVGGSFLFDILQPIATCGLFGQVDHLIYYTLGRMRLPDPTPEPVDRAKLDWRQILARPTIVLVEVNEYALAKGEPLVWIEEFIADVAAALN